MRRILVATTATIVLGLFLLNCNNEQTTQNAVAPSPLGKGTTETNGCDGMIGDFVWFDINCNGRQETGEPGIGGVTVTLKDMNGNLLATTTTGANGAYAFVNLCFGDYKVEVTTPSGGYVPTTPEVGDIYLDSNPNPSDVKLDSGHPKDETIDFGFCIPSTGGCGRMTGGGSNWTVEGARVTKGFEIHCDLTAPNNIEVNWPGNNKFHMTTLTSAVCTDDPNIIQAPPAAPFDTFTGEGTGKYNNVPGATIHFVFVDAGEPGKNDSATIQVWDAGGNLVLSVSSLLRNGNLQAHDDNCGDQ